MAELLAANQITIAKVLDGKKGADGYSPTVTTGTSSDGSTTVTVTNKDGSTTTELVDGTAREDAANAAKVATNFISYNSTDGLIVGNKTSGTWSGYHSQILPDSFNILDESSTVLASFGPTTVIGEEAKANLHLTFNNFSMVNKDGTKFFEVGDTRNADGIATIKHTETVTVNSAGSATVIVESNISSIVSVYADSVQLSSSKYSFNNRTVTINGFTANSVKYIEITYTTRDSVIYLTVGSREASGNIGNYSIAEGADVIAGGYASHAEGNATTASGFVSHAEGNATIAGGYASHAEGYATTASGFTSHAEGEVTTASGWNSHAEGVSTTASGDCSHAGGRRTVADGNCMTAIGKYNTKNSGKAFVVGNGTSDTARSDAFTVDWDGNTVMEGELAFGTAASAAATRANLGLTGAETKTLLWTNASPSSTFDNHTVEVDLSGYDSIEIEFKFNNLSPNCFVSRHRVGVESALIGVTGGPTALYPILRWFNFVTKGVNFSSTISWNLNADNSICIPLKIYGIKEM